VGKFSLVDGFPGVASQASHQGDFMCCWLCECCDGYHTKMIY